MISIVYRSSRGMMVVKVGEKYYYVDECRLWDESIFEGSSEGEVGEFLIEGGWMVVDKEFEEFLNEFEESRKK